MKGGGEITAAMVPSGKYESHPIPIAITPEYHPQEERGKRDPVQSPPKTQPKSLQSNDIKYT